MEGVLLLVYPVILYLLYASKYKNLNYLFGTDLMVLKVNTKQAM